jgi:CheY-like chemotaxis protein
VLVIDDEPQVSRAVARALAADHDVVAVESAAAALERLGAGEQYDAILCDVMMPQQGGVEFHSKLELLDAGLARRVVFITGGAFSEAAASFLARLPNPCIAKPFQAAQLRAALAQAAAS